MKNMIKKIIIILVILILLFSINSNVYAWSEPIKNAQNFLDTGSNSSSQVQKIDPNELKNLSGYLYNLLLAAGVVIAVGVATALGIQFMIGGAEGQAKVKETLIPFVVGCIIVFGGFGIWKIALTIGEKIETKQSEIIIESNPS